MAKDKSFAIYTKLLFIDALIHDLSKNDDHPSPPMKNIQEIHDGQLSHV
jgi:hypothetical protein